MRALFFIKGRGDIIKILTLKDGTQFRISLTLNKDSYIAEFDDYLSFNAFEALMNEENLSEHKITTEETQDIEVVKDKTVIGVNTVKVNGKIRATFSLANVDNTAKKLLNAERKISDLEKEIIKHSEKNESLEEKLLEQEKKIESDSKSIEEQKKIAEDQKNEIEEQKIKIEELQESLEHQKQLQVEQQGINDQQDLMVWDLLTMIAQ